GGAASSSGIGRTTESPRSLATTENILMGRGAATAPIPTTMAIAMRASGETTDAMAGVSSRMERASATTASFAMAKSPAEALWPLQTGLATKESFEMENLPAEAL